MRLAMNPATFNDNSLSLSKIRCSSGFILFFNVFSTNIFREQPAHEKIILGLLCWPVFLSAQLPDHIYRPNIRTVKLFKYGDIYSYPVIQLGNNEQLELHFDDLDNDVKNYYYSFQLCNADWTPANVQIFDYIRGFQTNRIGTYRSSSIVQTRYTHYQAILPERNSGPTKGGITCSKYF